MERKESTELSQQEIPEDIGEISHLDVDADEKEKIRQEIAELQNDYEREKVKYETLINEKQRVLKQYIKYIQEINQICTRVIEAGSKQDEPVATVSIEKPQVPRNPRQTVTRQQVILQEADDIVEYSD